MACFGVWMWWQSVQKHGAEKIVAWCARASVTDIWFLTKGLAGTTACHTSFAPHAGERDYLQEMLDAAHRRGIRVHAWFTSASDESYKQLHPESGRFHYVRGRDRGLISLTDEGYLAYMESIVREISRKYAIDGIHLDYIRYNHLLYGWSQQDVERYASAGADPEVLHRLMEETFLQEDRDDNAIFDALRAGDPNVQALANVRRRDVRQFARRLTETAKAENSRLILSAALMPEGAYDDHAFADLHYGQSYEDAASLYEYGLPMAYSQAYGKDAQWVRTVAEGSIRRGVKTIVGLHAYEGGTAETLQQDLAVLAQVPVHGTALFREGAFVWAFVVNGELCIANATDCTLDRMTIRAEGNSLSFDECIEPGSEKIFRLPFRPQIVSAQTGGRECSVYLQMM